MTTPPASRPAWPLTLLLAVAGVHLISAVWHILFGGMNADEGFYAIAARSVWQGDLPYRDFGHTQMPLLSYINGCMMQLTGFGLFAQRAVNGLWGAFTLGLAAVWLARRTSPTWALGLVPLLSLSAPWMYFIHLGKVYAFSGLVAVAAGWVYTEWRTGVKRTICLALLGTLGVGCRLPLAPYFALLWCAAVIELPRPSRRELLKLVFGSLLWPALLLLPFYLVAPEAAYFWTFKFHLVSVPDRTWRLPWFVIVALAPAIWLTLAGVLGHAVSQRRLPDRRELVLATATVVTLAPNLLSRGAFEEYGVPMLPPLMLATAAALWRAGADHRWLRHPLTAVGLLMANLGLTVALQWPHLRAEVRGTASMLLPLNAPLYDFSLPETLARARRTVADHLPPGRPFIGPMIILAAETGRPVPRHLRMGACSATADFPAAQAGRLNLATVPELEAYFADPDIPLVALSKNPHNNYLCSMPSFRNLSSRRTYSWSTLFQRDFLVAYEDADFLILVRGSPTPASP